MTSMHEAARIGFAVVVGWIARLRSTRAGIVLVYHRVGDSTIDPDLEILAPVSVAAFERQLRHVRRRYRVVPAAQILEAARSRRRGRRFPVAITFDDDLADHVRTALPALNGVGLPATFFLGGSSLEGPWAFWWEDLQKAIAGRLVRPDGIPRLPGADVRAALERSPRAILEAAGAIVRLEPEEREEVAVALRAAVGPPPADSGLRSADVRALAEAGHTVGFHTLRHDVLPALSGTALERALVDGREAVAAAAGAQLDLVAYPHGKADGRVAEAARKAGYALGFTTARGLVTPRTDPFLIPRTVADLSAGALAHRLAHSFARPRSAPVAKVSSGAHTSRVKPGRTPVSADVDLVVQENDRLRKTVRQLEERVAALESSRWWRLHPRFALSRLRGSGDGAAEGTATEEHAQHLPIDFDDADAELCRRVGPYTMTTPARIYALARGVEYVATRPVQGALVECGVWRGGSMMAVALTLLRLGITDRDLYLFDTFAGMTEPGEEDVKQTGEQAADLLARESRDSHHWAVAPIDQVRDAVLSVGYPEERIHFVEGPVEETLPEKAPAEIALLRLDTDWYSSTRHELVHLYPRLAQGGVLIIDDYAYWQGARRAVDEYLQENDLVLFLNRVDHTARVAVKPERESCLL